MAGVRLQIEALYISCLFLLCKDSGVKSHPVFIIKQAIDIMCMV